MRPADEPEVDVEDEESELMTDAELDAWVEQQERSESKRERALARDARARERAKAAEAAAGELDSEGNPAARKGLLARMRGMWPFGRKSSEDPGDLYQFSPPEQPDETSRTARGQTLGPDEGEEGKWR
jgi:hypothetical protein